MKHLLALILLSSCVGYNKSTAADCLMMPGVSCSKLRLIKIEKEVDHDRAE